MAGEHGPFASEAEAMATRAAATLRAAFDAAPVKRGAGVPARLALLTAECEASGVRLGELDASVLRFISRWEDYTAISVAGIIHRAYRAGLEAAGRGDGLGFVVVTFNQASGQPDIDTPGLHDERETADLERDDREARTAAVGRGERHEVAAVIRIDEGSDG